MAIVGDFTSKFGSTHNLAYAKIVSIQIDSLHNKADVMVHIFISADARNNDSKPIDKIFYDFSDSDQADNVFVDFLDADALDISNPFSIIYTWIKTKDEWNGWVDG